MYPHTRDLFNMTSVAKARKRLHLNPLASESRDLENMGQHDRPGTTHFNHWCGLAEVLAVFCMVQIILHASKLTMNASRLIVDFNLM